MFEAIYGLAI